MPDETIITKPTRPICLFLPSLAGGGAERVFVTIANEIASRNIPVDLIIANGKQLDYLSEVSDRVNTIILGVPRTLFALPKLATYLRQNKPLSIMTTMAQANFIGKAALLITKGSNTKHIIRQAIAPGIMPIKNALITAILKPLTLHMYRHAGCVVSVSNEMAELLQQQYGIDSNVKTIFNPIDTNNLQILAHDSPEKKTPWGDKYSSVIIGVGRLNKQKDFQTLIKAFSIVLQSEKAKLIILGEGPERATLQATINEYGLTDHVWMPGFIQNPFPYMQNANVFVLSSKYEGLPNALIQALLLDTRCVSTRCPTGPTEILENGRLGTLVNISEYESMAAAIINSLNKPNMNSTDRSTIQNRYSATKITDQYLDVLLPNEHHPQPERIASN